VSDNNRMTDTESDSEHVDESLQKIHQYVEQIAHDAKHLYSKALCLHQLIEHPDMDIWAQPCKLHERARGWAKKNMVASKCSLWEVNKTLLEAARKEGRVNASKMVVLTKLEAAIMNLPETPVTIWQVLGRLPKFFI
jgi:arabinogalactan endo-1,4-beta-galactosidase